jgi:DNA-binding MarR family transcriptional regulator
MGICATLCRHLRNLIIEDMKDMANGDYISELGALALASRLRRLLQRLHTDGERVYQTLNIDFKPKWFPALHLLLDRSSLTLTEMSRLMCISHPSMIETVDELVSAGLVKSRKSDLDGRIRELSLTTKGQRLCIKLQPVWDSFYIAAKAANEEVGNNFLEAVERLERSLDRLSLYDRIMAQLEIRKKEKNKK